MKRIILCLSLFAFFGSQAQQINPVPDYVFSNKMSVGRNAVTDTAAYFSIGPRYGAIRGMMPPMVTDTASMSATKRNGLLIFSIQKNKYLYWDSVGSKWAEMAGTTGSALTSGDTASMLSPYIRAAGNGLTKSGQSLLVDTASIATRARVQKAVDSINANVALKVNISDTASMLTPYTRGSGTTNYLPKFTGTRTLGNSVAFDNGGTELLINTTTDAGAFTLQMDGNANFNASTAEALRLRGGSGLGLYQAFRNTTLFPLFIGFGSELNSNATINDAVLRYSGSNNLLISGDATERARFNGAGEFLINTTTDAGAYAFQVSGSQYLSGSLSLGTTSAPLGTKRIRTAYQGGLEFEQSNGGVTASMSTYNTYDLQIENNNADIRLERISGKILLNPTSTNEVLINTSTDAGAYALQVAGAIYNTTTITTGAPSGGTAKPFKIGAAATVSPTSPNRTIEIEIDGVTYYLHAKTTNN